MRRRRTRHAKARLAPARRLGLHRAHRGRGQRSSINGEITCQLLVYLAVRLQSSKRRKRSRLPEFLNSWAICSLVLKLAKWSRTISAAVSRRHLQKMPKRNEAMTCRARQIASKSSLSTMTTSRAGSALNPGPPESLRCRFSDDIAGTAEIGNRLLDGRGQLRSRGGLARLGADRVGHLAEALSGSHKHNPNE